MTKQDGITLMNRLQDDPTRKLLGPTAWLNNHRTDVQGLIDFGRMRELAEHVGISPAVILRWQRQHGVAPAQETRAGDSDRFWWKGYAAAMEKALTLAMNRGQA